MSLLPSLRHAPAALLRGLQACAGSCHAVAPTSTSSSSSSSSSSPACACGPCAARGFSTAAASPSPSQQQQEEEAGPRKETLQETRARVFDQHLGDDLRSGRKYLLRPLKGPAMQDWYMTDIGGSQPLLEDDMETQWVPDRRRRPCSMPSSRHARQAPAP
jgi:hypothetical protein